MSAEETRVEAERRWDFADWVLDFLNIEDQNPPGLTEAIADKLAEWQASREVTTDGELIQRVREMRHDASLNADEVAVLDRVIEVLASREVTDAAVEDGCRAFYNDASEETGLPQWDSLVAANPELAERYRDGMRAALVAAREARS